MTPDEMHSDDGFGSILFAARAGAAWAWAELYDDVAQDLSRYVRASRVEDPDDVVGNVFLRAVGALGRFDGDRRAFRAWMFALARNAVIDEGRKVVRRRTQPLPPEVLAEIGPTVDAEREALRHLAERGVRDTLDHLSPDQRDVLLLRILGDLTIDEIAALLGKRPGAVKALQARGLARIRRNIASGAVTL
jgi:RNA polymerase sigma-70 factor, ECF subfamily